MQNIPIALIEILSQQFYRWLSAIDLLGWHVQIVNEYNALLSHWRAKHSLTPPVQL